MSELRLNAPSLSPPTVRSPTVPSTSPVTRPQRPAPAVLCRQPPLGLVLDGFLVESAVSSHPSARHSSAQTLAGAASIVTPACAASAPVQALAPRPASQVPSIRNPQLVDTQYASGVSVAQQFATARGQALEIWRHPDATTAQRNAISRGVRDLDAALSRVNSKELAVKRATLDTTSDDTRTLFAILDLLLKMCAALSANLDSTRHPGR